MKTLVVLDEALIRMILKSMRTEHLDPSEYETVQEARRQLQLSLQMLANARGSRSGD